MVKMSAMLGLVLGIAAWAQPVSAQVGVRLAPALAPRIAPLLRPPVEDYNPRLGFQGHFDFGKGMHVENVVWGTPASQAGLEPGDVIRSINGQRVQSLGHYQSLLRQGAGEAVLTVVDVRSGQWVQRFVRYERPQFEVYNSARPVFNAPRPY